MSKRQRNAIAQKVEHAELKQENARLMKQVEQLLTANTLLKAAADKGEQHRQEAIRREVDNQYLEARNQTLRYEMSTVARQLDASENRAKAFADLHENANTALGNKLLYIQELRHHLMETARETDALPVRFFLEPEKYSDRDLVDALLKTITDQQERIAVWKGKWDSLWASFEKTCKQLASLLSVAADVYDFCFEDDRDPHVRRLRRTLKVLHAFITRKEETPEDAKKLA